MSKYDKYKITAYQCPFTNKLFSDEKEFEKHLRKTQKEKNEIKKAEILKNKKKEIQ